MACRLTLICPSLERHHYLERSCRFWGDRDDVCVLYADGSQSQLELLHVNASNLRYSHRPIGYQERLLWLIDQVDTPYICVLSDDEFYLPSALNLCVDFLDEHPDYVSCMGRAIGFSRLNDKIALLQQYPRLRDRDLSDAVTLNRLETHFSSYVPSHFYAVTRTDIFRNAIKAAFAIELDVYAIFELSTELLIVAAGRSIVLPALYWLRSHEAPPLRNTGDLALDPSKRFVHWWQNMEFERQKKTFCKHLSAASSNVVDEDNVRKIFDCYVESAYGQATVTDHSLLRRLKRTVLAPIKKPLRLLTVRGGMLFNQLIRPAAQNKAALQELRDQGVLIDEDGLAECLSSIEESWRP